MVESAFDDDWYLQGNQRVSKRRVIRYHIPNAPRGMSIGANIAEGTGRRSDGELTRYLHIARGSAAELEYHLLLARDLDLLSSVKFDLLNGQVDEVQRMLTSLIQQVQPIQRAKSTAARQGLTDVLFVSKHP